LVKGILRYFGRSVQIMLCRI